MDENDIIVSLTATEHIAESMVNHQELIKGNAPVCMAVSGILMPSDPRREQMEHIMAEKCKEMAKTVCIDTEGKTIFVGGDPADLETGLVEYTEKMDTKYTRSFFGRWTEIELMLFIFQCWDVGTNSSIFCLRGLWGGKDSWRSLEIYPSSNIHILPRNPS